SASSAARPCRRGDRINRCEPFPCTSCAAVHKVANGTSRHFAALPNFRPDRAKRTYGERRGEPDELAVSWDTADVSHAHVPPLWTRTTQSRHDAMCSSTRIQRVAVTRNCGVTAT